MNYNNHEFILILSYHIISKIARRFCKFSFKGKLMILETKEASKKKNLLFINTQKLAKNRVLYKDIF
jgi:hypothetical protein